MPRVKDEADLLKWITVSPAIFAGEPITRGRRIAGSGRRLARDGNVPGSP